MTPQRPIRQGRGHRDDHNAQMLTWLRTHRGMSLRGLAKAVGISPGYLHDLESGRRPISVALLPRLSVALDCTPSVIMHGQEDAA